MPKSSSSDIPHVSITDHKISVFKGDQTEKGDFLSLYCVNNSNPDPLSKAKAYLKHYESFDKNPLLLDSAERFLNECSLEESFPFIIQFYYLKNQYKNIIELVEKNNLNNILKYYIK